jgi:hypothetical protein
LLLSLLSIALQPPPHKTTLKSETSLILTKLICSIEI